MNEADAQRILAEAQVDTRITATLETRYARRDGQGYQVVLVLRGGLRQVTLRRKRDWRAVQALWKDL